MRFATVMLLVGLATAPARAEEPTAADVESAPLPGEESGRTDDGDEDSLLRNIGQGVLTPPRVAIEVAFAPVRAGVWAYERYQLDARFKQIFFDDSYTYGLYPTLIIDASYGVTYGARAVHRNLFGKREHLALRAATGGEYRSLVEGGLRSGERFGRVKLELGGELERHPADSFYGIGNSVEAVHAHHRQAVSKVTTSVDVRAISDFHVGLAGAYTELDYGRSDEGPPIDELYSPMTLTGFAMGASNLYGELELRWDSRRYPTRFDSHAAYASGSLVAAYAGRVHQLDAGDDYWRYGGELQRFWRLGTGPRVLATRLRGQAVTGRLPDVAFTELPQLGGKEILRGYPRERFRDRTSLVTTAEYQWDLSRWLMASLFVDVGRVFPEWGEIDYRDMRAGYGASIQLHMSRQFLGELSVASSVDGGLFVNFAFDPVFDLEPRVEQK